MIFPYESISTLTYIYITKKSTFTPFVSEEKNNFF